jgi:hypothetical protein
LASKLINSTGHKKELPEQWKEYLNLPVYKKGNKTTKYEEASQLSTTYTTLFSI